MISNRCQGLMTREEPCNWGGGKWSTWSTAFRCISCGELIDQVILTNRRRKAAQINHFQKQPRIGGRVAGIRPTESSAGEFS
jgi:hypothetical protein